MDKMLDGRFGGNETMALQVADPSMQQAAHTSTTGRRNAYRMLQGCRRVCELLAKAA
jgi:hypothetical protein